MFFVSLTDVQDAFPELGIYAWRWDYDSKLKFYHAFMWMKAPSWYPDKSVDKVRLDQYVPEGVAVDLPHVLAYLWASILMQQGKTYERN